MDGAGVSKDDETFAAPPLKKAITEVGNKEQRLLRVDQMWDFISTPALKCITDTLL